MSAISSGPATPPSSNPDQAPAWKGGKPTNKQVLKAIEYSQIGGGKGAPETVKPRREDADYVVRNAEALATRCQEADRLVWIPDDVAIDITGRTLDVRATVASSRGQGNSEGALVYSNDRGKGTHAWDKGSGSGQVQLRGNGRLVGFRLRGWAHNVWANREHPGYIPFAPGDTLTAREAWRSQRYARGVKPHSNSVRIENMEIYGWAYCAVHIGSTSTSYTPRIWWCHIHDNMMTSYGYGIDTVRGRPNIRYCYFNAHRHAVDGFGFPDCSFVVEDCVFGPSASSHQVDMHGLHNNFSSAKTVPNHQTEWYHGQAGGRMIVRRNTALYTHVIPDANFDRGLPNRFVSIRGIPWPRSGDGIIIERNAVAHPEQTRNSSSRSAGTLICFHQQTSSSRSGQQFTYPTNAQGYSSNYKVRDNRFSILTTAPPAGYGAPVDLRNPPTAAQPTPESPADTPVLDPMGQDPDPDRREAVSRGGRILVADLSDLKTALRER